MDEEKESRCFWRWLSSCEEKFGTGGSWQSEQGIMGYVVTGWGEARKNYTVIHGRAREREKGKKLL